MKNEKIKRFKTLTGNVTKFMTHYPIIKSWFISKHVKNIYTMRMTRFYDYGNKYELFEHKCNILLFDYYHFNSKNIYVDLVYAKVIWQIVCEM